MMASSSASKKDNINPEPVKVDKQRWTIAQHTAYRIKQADAVDNQDYIRENVMRINKIIAGTHEFCGPHFTKQQLAIQVSNTGTGGITGTLKPGGIALIFRLLCSTVFGLAASCILNATSHILDVGSGAGNFVCYAASLPLASSVGFEIHSEGVVVSRLNLNKLFQNEEKNGTTHIRCPTFTIPANLFNLKSFGLSTHLYIFSGFREFVSKVAMILTDQETEVKVVVATAPNTNSLRVSGFLGPRRSKGHQPPTFTSQQIRNQKQLCPGSSIHLDVCGDVLSLPVAMTGKVSYRAYILVMTVDRLARMKKCNAGVVFDEEFTNNDDPPGAMSIRTIQNKCLVPLEAGQYHKWFSELNLIHKADYAEPTKRGARVRDIERLQQ
jgi:hypothetical protein